MSSSIARLTAFARRIAIPRECSKRMWWQRALGSKPRRRWEQAPSFTPAPAPNMVPWRGPSASAKATHSMRPTSTAPRKQREGDGARLSARSLGVPFQWVRLFGVFGPGEAPHRLLPYVHDRLSRGERVDLTAGLQWRDLLYVEDAAKGLLRAAEIALEGRLGPFNLCTGEARHRARHGRGSRPPNGRAAQASRLRGTSAARRRADVDGGDGSLLAHAGGFRHSIGLSDGVARTLRALDHERRASSLMER